MKAITFAFLFVSVAILADEHSTNGTSNEAAAFQRKIEADHQLALRQEPIGSTTSWSVVTNDERIIFHFHNNASGSNWTVNGGQVSISLPGTYKDTDSGIIFYLESDGRHISAIGSDGKLLWRRDPFADSHLEFYRTHDPKIVYVGKATERSEKYYEKQGKKVIGIGFNSSQAGSLDLKTGDFFFEGQN